MTERKHFTPVFKLEIAKLLVEVNYSIKQACQCPVLVYRFTWLLHRCNI